MDPGNTISLLETRSIKIRDIRVNREAECRSDHKLTQENTEAMKISTNQIKMKKNYRNRIKKRNSIVICFRTRKTYTTNNWARN